jgi:hypothetical protein
MGFFVHIKVLSNNYRRKFYVKRVNVKGVQEVHLNEKGYKAMIRGQQEWFTR